MLKQLTLTHVHCDESQQVSKKNMQVKSLNNFFLTIINSF